jgi:hypothetical protein
MKIPGMVVALLVLTVGGARPAALVGQEMTVLTGLTESTVVGQVQILPGNSEVGATVDVPIPLPRTAASSPGTAYAAAMPSLAVGTHTFLPTGFRRSDALRGLPRDWEMAVFQFRLPIQSPGRPFVAKLMYVQPNLRKAVPFCSLSPQIPPSASKVTFVPGNGYTVELVSRTRQPAAVEEGMLTLQPVYGELVLVRRIAVPESPRVARGKKPAPRRIFVFPNPFKFLFPRRDKGPEAPGTQSILP